MDEFEPRRAEPGQEFGYTGTDEKMIGIDEDVPEGWAHTGTKLDDDTQELTHRIITRAGVQKTLKADDQGVVHPRTAEEKALLDSFDLPVARKAIAESKAAEAPKPKE